MRAQTTTVRKLALLVSVLGFAALIAPVRADAATRTYPSATCPPSATGLNACIAAANDLDTINVKPGVYNESATVGKAVKVTGPCTGKAAVIDVNGLGVGFNIATDGVTLNCLTIQNGNSATAIDNSGPSFNSLHVNKVKVSHVNYGVFTENSTDLIIKNSTFSAIATDAINGDAPSTNAKITGNKIANVGGFCIIMNGATTSDVSKNDLGRCGNNGVYIQNGAGNTVKNNKVHTTANNGYAISSGTTTISGNTVTGSENSGFYSDGASNTLTNNSVLGDTNDAAFSLSGANLVVTGNTVAKGAKFDGIICSPCDTATVTGNKILGRVGSDGIHLDGDTSSVSNNTVTGGGHGNGIEVSGKSPVVDANKVSGGNGNPGIGVDCTASCDVGSVSNNKQSGTYNDHGIVVTANAGCAAFPCMVIANNTSTDNLESGFRLDTQFADIKTNTASASGWGGGGCASGFRIVGNSNQLTKNVSTGNACDGFYNNASSNTYTQNTASKNGQMGYHNKGDANKYDKNIAKKNTGDGFNNDGTNATFSNNTSSGNRQDCTNDVGEGASLTSATGNACADGTNFTVNSTLIDED